MKALLARTAYSVFFFVRLLWIRILKTYSQILRFLYIDFASTSRELISLFVLSFLSYKRSRNILVIDYPFFMSSTFASSTIIGADLVRDCFEPQLDTLNRVPPSASQTAFNSVNCPLVRTRTQKQYLSNQSEAFLRSLPAKLQAP